MNIVLSLKTKSRDAFPALTHKNFRYFWIGQCISLIGTWMQNTGQSWLVLTLTDSAFLLGLVNALQFTPMLIFSLFAGVIIDRLPKKKILVYTQLLFMVLATILAILVWTDSIKYWHILILSFLLGCANTIDMPTRQAFMIDLVGKDDLVNAIALNSSIFNAARLVGPAVSGILIHYIGFTACFFINALSFIPVIYGILHIDVVHCKKDNKIKKNIIEDIKQGLKYIKSQEILYKTVIIIAIVGTFLMNYSVLIPVLAKDTLKMGSQGFGYLLSAMGAGSLLGALMVAIKSKVAPNKKKMYLSSLILCILFVVMSFVSKYYMALIIFFIIGFFNIIFTTTGNSTLQLNSTDDFRGRVMSVYSLVFTGVTPIGSIFSGTICNNAGVSQAFLLSGIITLIFILILIRKNIISIIKSKYQGAISK